VIIFTGIRQCNIHGGTTSSIWVMPARQASDNGKYPQLGHHHYGVAVYLSQDFGVMYNAVEAKRSVERTCTLPPLIASFCPLSVFASPRTYLYLFHSYNV
jgi:hypothetical protein